MINEYIVQILNCKLNGREEEITRLEEQIDILEGTKVYYNYINTKGERINELIAHKKKNPHIIMEVVNIRSDEMNI